MPDFGWLGDLQKGSDSFTGKLKDSVENIYDRAKEWIIEPREDTLTDLKLHIYGTETMSLDADITDYYVENNIAYQNHIALKPRVFTIVGEVGELTWFSKNQTESVFWAVPQKLLPVVSFLPPFSKKASSIQDKTMKLIGVLDSVDNFANRILNLLSDEDVNTEQKKIYKYLMLLWQNREPINIQTPYGKLSNYVIKSVELTQPDRTKDKSQIKISLKEFRTVIEKRTKIDKKKLQGRKSAQQAAKQQKGTTSGIKMTKSICKPGSIYIDEKNQMSRVLGGIK